MYYTGIIEEIEIGRLSESLLVLLEGYELDSIKNKRRIMDSLRFIYELRLLVDDANIDLEWTERLYLANSEESLLEAIGNYLDEGHVDIREFLMYYEEQLTYIYEYSIIGRRSKSYLNSRADIEFWNSYLLHKKLTREANVKKGTMPFIVRDKINKFTYKKYGLYFLYNDTNELIYVGKSRDLSRRIIQSAEIRNATKFRFAYTSSLSDMHLYEVYYISKLKPRLNKEFKNSDGLSIVMPNLDISRLYDLYY